MANPSNESWTLLTGLANPYPGDAEAISHHPYRIPRTDDRRAVPNLKVIERLDGATVVRLAFRPGDSMADHTAPAPILIFGQVGEIAVTISDDDGETSTVSLEPGTALHIAARKVHSLSADNPATATLVILQAD